MPVPVTEQFGTKQECERAHDANAKEATSGCYQDEKPSK